MLSWAREKIILCPAVLEYPTAIKRQAGWLNEGSHDYGLISGAAL